MRDDGHERPICRGKSKPGLVFTPFDLSLVYRHGFIIGGRREVMEKERFRKKKKED